MMYFFYREEKPTDNPSRGFKDFEEEWLELGERFNVNTGTRKRKLDETEDSVEITIKRRKLNKDQKEAIKRRKLNKDREEELIRKRYLSIMILRAVVLDFIRRL
jgi:hypothetical protein